MVPQRPAASAPSPLPGCGRDPTWLADAVAEARAAEQELVVPKATHLARALALQNRIRVLDGLYVALAESRDCPLVSTDQRLSRARPPCEVRSAPTDPS